MDVKKIIMYAIGVFLILSVLGNGLQYFGTRRNNKLLDEYKTTADEFERKFEAERARNLRLTELNTQIERRLTERLEQAEGTLGDIAEGISGDVTTLDGIIRAIQQVIDALESYEYN